MFVKIDGKYFFEFFFLHVSCLIDVTNFSKKSVANCFVIKNSPQNKIYQESTLKSMLIV